MFLAFYEYKVNGYIYDVTRKSIEKINSIHKQSGVAKAAFNFAGNGFTHFLTVEELRELYPFVGTNLEAIKVLYGQI